jgi:hypothetical protein
MSGVPPRRDGASDQLGCAGDRTKLTRGSSLNRKLRQLTNRLASPIAAGHFETPVGVNENSPAFQRGEQASKIIPHFPAMPGERSEYMG